MISLMSLAIEVLVKVSQSRTPTTSFVALANPSNHEFMFRQPQATNNHAIANRSPNFQMRRHLNHRRPKDPSLQARAHFHTRYGRHQSLYNHKINDNSILSVCKTFYNDTAPLFSAHHTFRYTIYATDSSNPPSQFGENPQ